MFGTEKRIRQRMEQQAQAKALQYVAKNGQAMNGLNGIQAVVYFAVMGIVAELQFLLICADGAEEKYETTISAKVTLNCRIDQLKGIRKQLLEPLSGQQTEEGVKGPSEQLALPYSFFGEMMFQPLADDANAIILEIEKILEDEPPVDEDETFQDMIMGFLLQDFEVEYEWDETQEAVIDYLRKRWGIDGERYENLIERCFTHEELVAMLDKIAKKLNIGEDTLDPTKTQA